MICCRICLTVLMTAAFAVCVGAAEPSQEPYLARQPGLDSLPLLGRGRTRSISAENPQITYVETEVPAAAGTFHAQYRRAATAERNPYVILNGVKGRGRYAGTFLARTQMT